MDGIWRKVREPTLDLKDMCINGDEEKVKFNKSVKNLQTSNRDFSI
jgi:hypothetical protein